MKVNNRMEGKIIYRRREATFLATHTNTHIDKIQQVVVNSGGIFPT
jgi:cAMP phosphodiesterase